MPAFAHFERPKAGPARWRRLTHGAVVEELRSFWQRTPPEKGDVAYIAGRELSWSARLAGHAFTADGFTKTLLGTPGRELEQMREVRPQLAVAPRELVN